MPKKRTADEYTADDGFVVDAPEDDDHEKEEVGQRKKQKVKSAARVGKSAGAGGGGGNVPGGGSKDKDGADFWEVRGDHINYLAIMRYRIRLPAQSPRCLQRPVLRIKLLIFENWRMRVDIWKTPPHTFRIWRQEDDQYTRVL